MLSVQVNRILFYATTGGFVLGIILRSLLDIGTSEVLFCFFLSGVFLILLFLRFVKWEYCVALVLALSSLGLGVLRTDYFDTPVRTPSLDAHLESSVRLVGGIIDEPQSDGVRQRFTVDVGASRVRVFADIYPELKYGDTVVVEGNLALPENFAGETGREFDYVHFLEKDKIGYQMFYPDLEITERGGGLWIKRKLFGIKGWFVGSMSRVMPDPHASLMSGITVGADEGLGDKLEQDFRTTGIIHIVVLSGYNVTIIADILARLLAFLPLLARSFFAGSAVVLFALLTGAGATIVRASIMALLVLLARILRRPRAVTRALVLAGVLMLIHNPFILLFDPSFQLSFLATLGLIYVTPIIEPYLTFIPERLALREALSSTLATQIFVFPAILYMMGTLSIVSPFVNALVLPMIPFAMGVGFLTSIVAVLGNVVAMPFALLASVLAEYVFWVVGLFARLPFSSISLGSFPFAVVVGIYMLYAILLYRLYLLRNPAPK